jgi:hypothetical protein
MKKTSKSKRPVSAESIARLADNGQDISSHFTNKGKMMPPLDSLNLDLNEETIQELNQAARKLKVSRQALVKRFIRRGLDQQYLANKDRKAG